MSANQTAGAITISRTYDATVTPQIFPSRNTTGIYLNSIPATVEGVPTCVVTLPDNPSNGDRFYIANEDGTCDSSHIILITPGEATTGESTIASISGWAFINPFAGATFIYNADENDWLVDQSATSAFIQAGNQLGTFNAGTAGAPVAAGNMSPPAAAPGTILAAAYMDPTNTGLVLVAGTIDFALSATDTVTLTVSAESGLTAAVSGGSTFTEAGVGAFHVESGTGAGQPVVVPSTVTTVQSTYQRVVPAAEIAHVSIPVSCWVVLPPGGPTFKSAISFKLTTTGGSNITGITCNLGVKES